MTTSSTTSDVGPEGLVIIDKPAGLTSHDVVAKLRKVLGTRKVGHAGTLDPMATGVLVCGVGRATRLMGLLALDDKCYLATARLGVVTVTDDAEGEVVERIPAHISDDDVERALASQRGTVMQRPSSVSAIKVAGRTGHERVRAGENVVLAKREVTISQLTAGAVRHGVVDASAVTDVDLRVECSSGTYVRAIARDMGDSLGVGGHLTALRRTRVGPFTLDEAQPLQSLLEGEIVHLLGMAEAARRALPALQVSVDDAAALRHGVRVAIDASEGGPFAVFGPDGTLLCVSDVRGGRLDHRFVVAG